MITFRGLNEDDLNRFKQMIGICINLNVDFNGSFSMYQYKGEDRCLYYDEGYGLIFRENGEYLDYRAFCLDANFELTGMQLDRLFYERENDMDVFTNQDTGVKSSLVYYKRPNNEVDRDGCNGVIAYVQYNPYYDKRVTVCYQQYKARDDEKGFIFEQTFSKKPLVICFENNVVLKESHNITPAKKKYMRVDGEIGGSIYNLLTINEYGLIKFLTKGSYQLQKEESISRYYRILRDDFMGYTISTFPVGFQHNIEELDGKLDKYGFLLRPPVDMVDIYNRGLGDRNSEFKDVSMALKDLHDKDIDMDCSTLVL